MADGIPDFGDADRGDLGPAVRLVRLAGTDDFSLDI